MKEFFKKLKKEQFGSKFYVEKVWASKVNSLILFEGSMGEEQVLISYKKLKKLRVDKVDKDDYEVISNRAIIQALVDSHNRAINELIERDGAFARKVFADKYLINLIK